MYRYQWQFEEKALKEWLTTARPSWLDMPVPFFVGEWNFFANFGNEWLHLHPDKFTRYPICSSLKVNSNLDRETIFRVRCVVPVPISNGPWSREARNRPGRRPRPCLRRPSRTSSVDGWPPVRHQLAVRLWFGRPCAVFLWEFWGWALWQEGGWRICDEKKGQMSWLWGGRRGWTWWRRTSWSPPWSSWSSRRGRTRRPAMRS